MISHTSPKVDELHPAPARFGAAYLIKHASRKWTSLGSLKGTFCNDLGAVGVCFLLSLPRRYYWLARETTPGNIPLWGVSWNSVCPTFRLFLVYRETKHAGSSPCPDLGSPVNVPEHSRIHYYFLRGTASSCEGFSDIACTVGLLSENFLLCPWDLCFWMIQFEDTKQCWFFSLSLKVVHLQICMIIYYGERCMSKIITWKN